MIQHQKPIPIKLSRDEFLRDFLGRLITVWIAIAEGAGSDWTVTRLLIAKDKLNRRRER
jgi:hypothetical protein